MGKKKKKKPSLWETEKEKECEARKRTEMLAVTWVFFCDFYFLAVWWGKCESRTYCEEEDGAVFLLVPETYNNYFNTYAGAPSYKQGHCWVARSLAVWDGTLILSLLKQVFQFCAGCFPCQSKKISLYFLFSFGIIFLSGRSWKSITLDPVRDVFDDVPKETVLVRLWRRIFQQCVSLVLAWGSEGLASSQILS